MSMRGDPARQAARAASPSHKPVANLSLAYNGSSPLVRGTHPARTAAPHQCRFIPAGAGNTPGGRSLAIPRAVHPRWCGEHMLSIEDIGLPDGSSPLVRGTLPLGEVAPGVFRFIPAGAGNTCFSCAGIAFTPVHPRWCGEHLSYYTDGNTPNGSSPLVRGTLGNLAAALQVERFIPAGAGNTRPGWVLRLRIAVHPRWRGEHVPHRCTFTWLRGSSPLARGTPRLRYRADDG